MMKPTSPLYALQQHQIGLAKIIKAYNNNKLSWAERNNEVQKLIATYPSIKKGYYDLSYEFRHNHIAYCELRGRERDKIEMPHDDHKADEDYITNIKKFWQEKIDEAIRARQERSIS